MTGWVSVSRSMIKHHMFDGDVYSRRDAWLWLISKAAWKDTKHRVGGKVVNVPRGSLYCTLRELANEWKWKSDFRVRKFLKDLENDQMITQDTTQGKTQISLCNYSIYQDAVKQENAEINASATQKERTKGTNKQITNTTLHSGELDLIQLETDLREAANLQNATAPNLLVLSDPIRWLGAGCDMALDIIPTLRAKSHAKVNSWTFFNNPVFEARDKRLAPAPEIVRPNFQQKNQQMSGTDMLRAHANGEI